MASRNDHILYAFAEMTITLDEVVQISNILVDGDVIIGSFDMSNEEVLNLVNKCLGEVSSVLKQELENSNGQILRLDK